MRTSPDRSGDRPGTVLGSDLGPGGQDRFGDVDGGEPLVGLLQAYTKRARRSWCRPFVAAVWPAHNLDEARGIVLSVIAYRGEGLSGSESGKWGTGRFRQECGSAQSRSSSARSSRSFWIDPALLVADGLGGEAPSRRRSRRGSCRPASRRSGPPRAGSAIRRSLPARPRDGGLGLVLARRRDPLVQVERLEAAFALGTLLDGVDRAEEARPLPVSRFTTSRMPRLPMSPTRVSKSSRSRFWRRAR